MPNLRSSMRLVAFLLILLTPRLKMEGVYSPNSRLMMLAQAGLDMICQSSRMILSSVRRGKSSDYVFLLCFFMVDCLFCSAQMELLRALGYSSGVRIQGIKYRWLLELINHKQIGQEWNINTHGAGYRTNRVLLKAGQENRRDQNRLQFEVVNKNKRSRPNEGENRSNEVTCPRLFVLQNCIDYSYKYTFGQPFQVRSKIPINYPPTYNFMNPPQPKDHHPLQLPSLQQFYITSFSNYTQLTLKKIETHLSANHTPSEITTQSQQGLQVAKYHKISNQELKRRGCYLLIAYELIMVYGQFVDEMSPKIYYQVSKGNNYIVLSVWLQKLRLGSDQLSKLTRLKKSIQQDLKVEYFNRKLIAILYETQIYIFQILIRLIILQSIYNQNQKFNNELKQLKNKFKPQHLPPELQASKELIEFNPTPMRKSAIMKCKQLFKQVNSIITFYQLEISTNRQDCRVKPELEFLLQLLEEKFSKELLIEIYRKTELGDLSLQIKQSKKSNVFAPFILVPMSSQTIAEHHTEPAIEVSQMVIDTSKNQKLQNNYIDLRQFQSSQVVSAQQEERSIEVSIQKNQLSPNQLPIQQKQQPIKPIINKPFEKTAESVIMIQLQSSNSQKSKSKIEAEKALSSYLNDKTKKSKYYTTKLSNYSHYKKLQYISRNQRFSSRCNLQNKLVKYKRKHSESQSPFSQEIRQYNDRVRKQSRLKQSRLVNRDEGVSLAEETPDERGLPFYERKEND